MKEEFRFIDLFVLSSGGLELYRKVLVGVVGMQTAAMGLVVSGVQVFHTASGIESPPAPVVPSAARRNLRIRLIQEEVDRELIPALWRGDLEAIADGAADAIYVIIGTCLEYGIPLDRVWGAVCEANLRKIDPGTGLVLRREDGKILKPVGWTAPDIAGILASCVEAVA